MAKIRHAVLSDLDALVALENASFDYDCLSRRSLRNFIKSPNHLLAVAEEEGVLVGYILLLINHHHHYARIYSLAVKHEHRGQGVARVLLAYGEGGAHHKRGVRLELKVSNTRAQHLYEQLGYAVVGKRVNYYEDGEDAQLMLKDF